MSRTGGRSRLGELRALKVGDVDLAAGVIHVRRSWDPKEGEIPPKSAKGTRTVPIVPVLRDYLDRHAGRPADDYVWGPFTWAVVRRARRAWKKKGLTPIGLHECRHTYVSLMSEAGFTLEEIAPYVGHSSTYMVERYRHLLPGHEQRAAERFAAYLERADTQARLAQIGG